MKFQSKTLRLMEGYHQLLEQDQLPPGAEGLEDAPVEQEAPAPAVAAPLTSEGELAYIKNMVDAAIFSPTPQEEATLLEFQAALTEKGVDARAIGEAVRSIISPISDDRDLTNELDSIS